MRLTQFKETEMLFGDKVKMIAAERGIERMELCRRSGISKQNMGKIWNNRTTDPRLGTVVAIAEAFNITPNELIADVEFVKEPN